MTAGRACESPVIAIQTLTWTGDQRSLRQLFGCLLFQVRSPIHGRSALHGPRMDHVTHHSLRLSCHVLTEEGNQPIACHF
jgi:hypothetical protein